MIQSSQKVRLLPAHFGAAALLCVTAFGLAGCQGVLSADAGTAQVRFVDTSIDAPALDLYVNGNGAAYNLGYATFTSYVPVSSGESRISANRVGTAQMLATAHLMLGGARQYTAVVSDRLGNLQEHLYPDPVPSTPAGMVSVRVLNEMNTGPVDVYLVPGPGALALATPVAAGLAYTADSGYVHLAGGPVYQIAVVPAGAVPGVGNLLTGVNVEGSVGTARTLVLGEPTWQSRKNAYAFVLEDQ